MNSRSKIRLASKTGATALALSLLASNAGAFCAKPQEATALRVSALRQQLMVAALACHEAGAFNRFVTAYQDAFEDSDRTLMSFFVRKDGGDGDAAYNSYKTRQANDASLRSLHDPMFCGEAASVFHAALSRDLPLAELVAHEGPLVRAGFASCTRDGETQMADAAAALPSFPVRHRDTLEGTPAATPASAPQVTPSVPATHQGIANTPPESPAAGNSPPPPDERDAQDAPPPNSEDRYADNSYDTANAYDRAPAMNAYPQAYAPPNPYSPYAGGWYGYRQMPMRQVQGPDGRWYLVPPYAR